MAQRRNGCRAQGEQAGVRGRERQPTGGEDAKNVSMGEERNVTAGLQLAGCAKNDSFGADCHLMDGFSPWHAIAEERPVRPIAVDIVSSEALVFPVVPFEQVGLDLSLRTQPGKFAGSPGALHGAGQNEREAAPGKV